MKSIWILPALVISLFLFSCGKTEGDKPLKTEEAESTSSSVNDGERVVCVDSLNQGFFTEDYALYHDNHGQLQIFDVATKRDRVYCFDPACEHDKRRKIETLDSGIEQVVEEGCMGYNISLFQVMIQGEHLIFLDDNRDIVQSDIQGANRKLIMPYPAHFMAERLFFSEDDIISTYSTRYELIEVERENGEKDWIFGDEKDKQTAGVGRVNLSSGRAVEVFKREDMSASIYYTTIRDKHLYFAYCYSDMPFMMPDGETWFNITDEWKDLSVEEYLKEKEKHLWMDIYDYDLASGELKCIVEKLVQGRTNFCNGFFAYYPETPENSNRTYLYRYSGEMFRELDGFMLYLDMYCEKHLIGLCEGEVRMIDEDTGEVLKRVKEPENYSFIPHVFIGKTCYGTIVDEDYRSCTGYISTEDFWSGRYGNAIKFNVD